MSFDGIQRPLDAMARTQGHFLVRGMQAPALSRDRIWEFTPRLRQGDQALPGAVLGTVPETAALEHRVLVPPDVQGVVEWISAATPRRVAEPVARIRRDDGVEVPLTLFHAWPVRRPRPARERLPAQRPMMTGQRILDVLFPIALGGAAGMPGGFGTGKTVLQQSLCKWSDADVIVFVGCGERGNEMTHLLRELPELADPRTGRPLAERTVLIANTSNMPVSARESSIYTGATIAEYYRDMGYRVALLADSTSRWAEALREISGRLGEMPAEEGYPPYLASRLAAFYERAGRVTALDGAEGAVTIISSISPPGGDLTEPVTSHTQAFTRTFWTLDKERAAARSFPAVSIAASYGDAPQALLDHWEREVGKGFTRLRGQALSLLADAERIAATARLVGEESLPDAQRFVLTAASLLDEGFLQQSSFDAQDAHCEPARQLQLLDLLLHFRDRGAEALAQGVAEAKLRAHPLLATLRRARSTAQDLAALRAQVDAACAALEKEEA